MYLIAVVAVVGVGKAVCSAAGIVTTSVAAVAGDDEDDVVVVRAVMDVVAVDVIKLEMNK